METTDFIRYRTMLEETRDALLNMPQDRTAIRVERTADATEEVQMAEDREFAIRVLGAEADLLRDIRAAIERMREGTFGRCSECGEMIAPRRLAALPWASYCIRCQQRQDAVDRRTRRGGEPDLAA
ncbi:MAG: TraR/DksA family transcriptional regulator [Bryobacterales bacterium]|nr:TraR/DksA family transcriptional regulator [Bryobacterales bacterium]